MAEDRIGFQFYGSAGKKHLVTVTKSLPKTKRKVPGCFTDNEFLSVQALEHG